LFAKILPALSVTCQTRTVDSMLDGGFVYRKGTGEKLLASVRSRLFGAPQRFLNHCPLIVRLFKPRKK